MRQLAYTMLISNNCALFHLWWKKNLVKHQKVSKYYENDCRSKEKKTLVFWNCQYFFTQWNRRTRPKWNNVIKNGPSKIFGWQSLKNLKWYGLFKTNYTTLNFSKLTFTNSMWSILRPHGICNTCSYISGWYWDRVLEPANFNDELQPLS